MPCAKHSLCTWLNCAEAFQHMPLHISVTVTECSQCGYNTVHYVHEGGGRTAVAQLVEALRYKSEGRGFDSRWCHWNFSLT